MAVAAEAPTGMPWLNDEERLAWMALGAMVLRLEGALDAQLRRDAGMTFFEYGVLAALFETPGHALRMSELAAIAEGSLPRLSQVVARLETKGWARRTPDPADGRSTLAILTEDGLAKLIAAAPGHVREVRKLILDPLTKTQVRQLASIGQRIARAIGPDDRCLPRQA